MDLQACYHLDPGPRTLKGTPVCWMPHRYLLARMAGTYWTVAAPDNAAGMSLKLNGCFKALAMDPDYPPYGTMSRN
jgi:hypothetical protein